jgi:phosphonate transport system permease protein
MSRRAIFGIDVEAIAVRHPAAFRANLGGRLKMAAIIAGMAFLFVFGLAQLEFSPARVLKGTGELGTLVGLMLPPDPGSWSRALIYVDALGETLAIAVLGTLAAAVLAFPFGFLAARNALPSWLVRFMTRRTLDTFRGIDILIWALIWINVVGLGPFAGVLAIICSDLGSFGKLFSEAIETADSRPVDGVTASGGSPLHVIRFGIIPQVLPVMASQVLYYIESNTRSATIIGIVGAGGIGLHLSEQIRTLEWQQVSFLIVMILLTVAFIDYVSARLRFAIIGTTVR